MPTTAYTQAAEWDDSQSPALTLILGASAPTLAAFATNLRLYYYGNGNTTYGTLQLPHSYLVASTLRPHVHFTWDANPAAASTVTWAMDYSIASVNGVFPAVQTASATYTCVGDEGKKHCILGLGNISGTGIRESAIMVFRIYRSAGTAAAAGLLSVDVHLQKSNYGTESEYPA